MNFNSNKQGYNVQIIVERPCIKDMSSSELSLSATGQKQNHLRFLSIVNRQYQVGSTNQMFLWICDDHQTC